MNTKKRLLIFIIAILPFLFSGCGGDQNRVSTLYIPAVADGISFTVTGYLDYREVLDRFQNQENPSGPVTYYIRIRNIDRRTLTIDASSFSVYDLEGNHYEISEIIYSNHPAGERELLTGSIVLAGLLSNADQPIENLTLAFTPGPGTRPFRVALFEDERRMVVPISMKEVANALYRDGDLPADVLFESDIFTYSDLYVPANNMYFEFPSEGVHLDLEYSNERDIGHVMVFAFVSTESAESNYQLREWNAGESARKLNDFSESAFTVDREIIFSVCHLTISMRFNAFRESITLDDAIEYARKLDQRLTKVACD